MSISPRSLAVATLAVTAAATIGWGWVVAQNPPVEKQPVMKRKLAHSQRMLEALALADFTAMEKSSDELLKCVREATWLLSDSDDYLRLSEQFRRSINEFKQAAVKKNIDAAALAYSDMTRDCVRCHKHIRESKR
jgi:cytochrome c556